MHVFVCASAVMRPSPLRHLPLVKVYPVALNRQSALEEAATGVLPLASGKTSSFVREASDGCGHMLGAVDLDIAHMA